MTLLPVEPLEAAGLTEDALRPWWDVVLAGYAAQQPAPPLDPLAEVVAGIAATPPAYERPVLAGVRDPATGRPAGFAMAWLPQRDNTHCLKVEHLVVDPAVRRRGFGTALLGRLVSAARDDGRTVVLVEVTEPLDAGPLGVDGTGTAGTAFARAAGAVDVALDVQRTLELDPAAPDGTGPAVAPGYELLAWTDSTPADLLDAMAVLHERMSVDAPLEDMTLEEEVWDADRVRAADRARVAGGRTTSTTAVRSTAGGDLVGYTVLTVSRTVPGVAYQDDTFVLSAHRGHGLGLALKRANQRRFRLLSPGTRTVHTWNAAVNGPMVAINEAVGYRPTAQVRVLELRLDA